MLIPQSYYVPSFFRFCPEFIKNYPGISWNLPDFQCYYYQILHPNITPISAGIFPIFKLIAIKMLEQLYYCSLILDFYFFRWKGKKRGNWEFCTRLLPHISLVLEDRRTPASLHWKVNIPLSFPLCFDIFLIFCKNLYKLGLRKSKGVSLIFDRADVMLKHGVKGVYWLMFFEEAK